MAVPGSEREQRDGERDRQQCSGTISTVSPPDDDNHDPVSRQRNYICQSDDNARDSGGERGAGRGGALCGDGSSVRGMLCCAV
eukprot:3578743-Rhodomonas_salina.3